jgi:putative GTP pyrophosphokinase
MYEIQTRGTARYFHLIQVPNVISKSKIDRLGDRLKADQDTEDDLRLLAEFRRSFFPAYESVIRAIRDELGLQPTGRPAKSTTSISDKLNRESSRLTQIQDIAGCRLIVSDIREQERVIADLLRVFPGAKVIDRRASPSHGYRAVHVIVNVKERPVEVQVRTSLQHRWAEVSEKFSDIFDPAIKYGSGDKTVRTLLDATSGRIAAIEMQEQGPAGAADEVIRNMKQEMLEFLEWVDTTLFRPARKGEK